MRYLVKLTSIHWLTSMEIKSTGICFGPVTLEQLENAKRCEYFKNVAVLPENKKLVDWVKENRFFNCPPELLTLPNRELKFLDLKYVLEAYSKDVNAFLEENKKFYLWINP